jgi:hypothetical protein
MGAKLVKRIVYAVVAAIFLFVGGKELLAAGLNLSSAMGLGVGLIFGYMAATGAG